MSKNNENALASILDLNANNIWNVEPNDIAELWENEAIEDGFPPYEEKL